MTSSDGWRRNPMVGHKRTGLFCPRSGTGTQAGILCSTASVIAKKTSSTDAQGREKETYPRESRLFSCEGSNRTYQRPEQRILFKSVSGKKSDGGLRPVINLRGLNCCTKKRTFKMSTIKDVSAEETGHPQ